MTTSPTHSSTTGATDGVATAGSVVTAATAATRGAVSSATTERSSLLVRFWLHAEGAAAFLAGAVLYFGGGGNAWLFLPLLLAPDLSMIGFLRDTRLGAFTYNLVHNWAAGLVVLGLGAALADPRLWLAGSLLIAHVGMDRAMGYGLKYPTAFRDTHLQRV
jgi:hypothetical protein